MADTSENVSSSVSDYGSDIELCSDDEDILRLLLQPSATATVDATTTIADSIADPTATNTNTDTFADTASVNLVVPTTIETCLHPHDPFSNEESLSENEYEDGFITLLPRHQVGGNNGFTTQNLAPGIDTPPLQPQTPTLDSTNNSIDANADTNKSPYDRFRAARKGLSVTDLVSNVWCEQQFEYTLARGYKRATPQMQKGTKLHRKLEEQVHSVVEVDVSTSEDRWGLRLWNLYQGFRGLLDGGIARELPVFGFLNNGVYVTGIVDEVSFVDPRNTADILRANTNGRSLEDEGSDEGGGTRRRGRCKKMKQLVVSGPDAFPVPPKGRRVAYLSDTKTRGIRSVPTASQQRATELQLMIYHRLLSQLFTGLLSFTLVLEHECLDGSARFSDGFIAQISKLIFDDENGLTLEDLLENNSLCGLWGLIQKQMEITIDAVGDTMGVSYRYQKDGEFFAFHFFENNKDVLDRHLQDTMEWWNGKRSTVGVDIEEAWKCSLCDFEDKCVWRLAKIEELKQIRRQKWG